MSRISQIYAIAKLAPNGVIALLLFLQKYQRKEMPYSVKSPL